MRIVAILLAVLFALFAAVQLNDPDPLLWTLAYGAVALLWGLAATGHYHRPATAVLALVFTAWLFTLLPDFVDWVLMGTPSIVGSMQAEEPHIELVREFGGLMVAIAALLYLLRVARKHAPRPAR
jgi:hypothetical protein